MIGEDVKRLEKTCDRMSKTLTEVRDWQIRFDGQAERIDKDINVLQREVFGNGTAGLKVRQQRQEDRCSAHLAEQSGKKTFIGRVAQTVVAVLIITFIFWLMGIFKTGQ